MFQANFWPHSVKTYKKIQQIGVKSYVIIYKNKKYASLLLKAQIVRARLSEESNRVAGWQTSILHRMGVVLMDNNQFDFKDLIAFATFIIVLLTFVFTFGR